MAMNEQEYLKDRLEDQINWYDRKSIFNKRWHIRLKIIQTLLALTIPLVAAFVTTENTVIKIAAGILGILVAFITSLSSIFKYHENWIEYRTVAESLKHEKFLYLGNANPYKVNNPFELLVERVETLISKENTRWVEHTKQENVEIPEK